MLENLADPENFVWAVVGNKCDLTFNKEHDSILELCQQLGTELQFFTSAKTGENVQETLKAVIRQVHKKNTTEKSKCTDSQKSGIQLIESRGSDHEKQGCCY